MAIHKLTNGNCYLDGSKLIGKVTEVDFPDLKYKMTDYKSLGMLGDVEIPSGFEKMEAKLKFHTFMYDDFVKATSFDKPVNITFRGNQEVHEAGAKIEYNVTIMLNGIAKNFPMGQFKQNEMTNLDLTFSIYSAKVIVSGVDLMEYDVFTNTYKIGGRDLNAAFKLNT
jgi:uncharacterized protein